MVAPNSEFDPAVILNRKLTTMAKIQNSIMLEALKNEWPHEMYAIAVDELINLAARQITKDLTISVKESAESNIPVPSLN